MTCLCLKKFLTSSRGGLEECETQGRTNKKIRVETVASEMANYKHQEAVSLLLTGVCHSLAYPDTHLLGAYRTPTAV